jgi:hypothetical protein
MSTLDLTGLPPQRVEFIEKLVKSLKEEPQNGNQSAGMPAEGQALYDSIRKLRDEIGPVDFNVADAVRELREES